MRFLILFALSVLTPLTALAAPDWHPPDQATPEIQHVFVFDWTPAAVELPAAWVPGDPLPTAQARHHHGPGDETPQAVPRQCIEPQHVIVSTPDYRTEGERHTHQPDLHQPKHKGRLIQPRALPDTRLTVHHAADVNTRSRR